MKNYLIEASADGARESVALLNATIEDVKRKLVELSWYGPYEDAIQDEHMKATVDSLDDEDNWHNGIWIEDGEQCWTRISTIDELIDSKGEDKQNG